jgi:hypothetical protein
VPPLYIGEIVLAVGLLNVVANGWRVRLIRTPTTYLLIAFMVWGALCTIPYLKTYGLNSLRDAVIWGYGVFALLLAPLLVRRGLVGRIPALYARLVPWIVVCAPAWVIAGAWVGIGGSREAAIVGAKPGDAAVHLGGAAAFLLAGVWARRASLGERARWFRWSWPALLVGVVAMGSMNRGGLLAVIAAILIVMILLPFKAGGKLLLAGATAVLLATFWLGSGFAPKLNRERRVISPEQIVQNLRSIGGGSGTEDLNGTVEWRRLWWNSIIDYTVHGEYFWTGKGFGLNVAYDDGMEPYPDSSTRSPHNGHLTILARAGVPGMVLWILLQLGFGLSMLVGFARARHAGEHIHVSLFAWILAYWMAFLVNASFDVYLEGPQGGIWFWCVFAYGLALVAGRSRQVLLQPQAWAPSAPRQAQAPTPPAGV